MKATIIIRTLLALAILAAAMTATAQPQCPIGQTWVTTTYGGYCYPNARATAEGTYSVQQLQVAKQAADQAAKEYNDLLAKYNNLLADYNSHPLPQPYSAPRGVWRSMLYGMGQAGMAHSGLPTDYEIQQTQYQQALQARQLAYEQLQVQYQSVQLAKQAADQAAKEYNALVNQAQQ